MSILELLSFCKISVTEAIPVSHPLHLSYSTGVLGITFMPSHLLSFTKSGAYLLKYILNKLHTSSAVVKLERVLPAGITNDAA